MDPYRICPCGSGKKYKFCCRERDRAVLQDADRSSLEGFESVQELIDRGCALLDAGHYAKSRAVFEDVVQRAPHFARGYTNLAFARFHEGAAAEALELVRHVVAKLEPENVYALGSMVHYSTVLGFEEEAQAAAEALKRIRAADPGAHFKQVEAFARLRWHEEILRTASRVHQAPVGVREDLYYVLGVAAANLGRYDDALSFLEQAESSRNHGPLAQRARKQILSGRRASGDGFFLSYLAPHQWIGLADLERLERKEIADAPGLLELLLDNVGREDVGAVHAIGSLGSPRAIRALRRIAEGTAGSRELRFAALQELFRSGEIGPEDPMRFWDGKGWTQVRVSQTAMESSPTHAVNDEDLPAFEAAVRLGREGRFAEAARAWSALVRLHPRNPVPLCNLAVMELRLERRAKARTHLCAALERDPDYLHARVALAQLLFAEGDHEAAHAELFRRGFPREAPVPTICAWIDLAARLAFERADMDEVVDLAEMLRELDPSATEIAGLSIERLTHARRGSIDERSSGEQRLRERLLSTEPTLAECFEGWNLERLRVVARVLDLRGSSRARKAELLAAIRRELSTRSTVEKLCAHLPAASRQLLLAIADAGGAIALSELAQRFGAEHRERERVTAGLSERLDALERLGLIAIGYVGSTSSAVIPSEIRIALRALPRQGGRGAPRDAPS